MDLTIDPPSAPGSGDRCILKKPEIERHPIGGRGQQCHLIRAVLSQRGGLKERSRTGVSPSLVVIYLHHPNTQVVVDDEE